MSITASCGHELKDGESTVPVALAGEACDAIEGFVPCVNHHSYCPACAVKARALPNFLKDEAAEDAFFDAYKPQPRK